MNVAEEKQIIKKYQKKQEKNRRKKFFKELNLIMRKTFLYLFIAPIIVLQLWAGINSYIKSDVKPINSNDLENCSAIRREILAGHKLNYSYDNLTYERAGDTIIFTIKNKGVIQSEEKSSKVIRQYNRMENVVASTIAGGAIGLVISLIQAYLFLKRKDGYLQGKDIFNNLEDDVYC